MFYRILSLCSVLRGSHKYSREWVFLNAIYAASWIPLCLWELFLGPFLVRACCSAGLTGRGEFHSPATCQDAPLRLVELHTCPLIFLSSTFPLSSFSSHSSVFKTVLDPLYTKIFPSSGRARVEFTRQTLYTIGTDSLCVSFCLSCFATVSKIHIFDVICKNIHTFLCL